MTVLVIIFIKKIQETQFQHFKILVVKNKYARGPFEFVLVT
jgi:hypothetical protein